MRHNFTQKDIQELICLAAEKSTSSNEFMLLRRFIDRIANMNSDIASVKEGDKVRILNHRIPGNSNSICGIVKDINGDKAKVYITNNFYIKCSYTDLEVVQTKEQMESVSNGTADSCDIPNVNNHDSGSIKIPVEVDLSDSYWDAYTADLAKEVALKVANRYNDPKEAAEYAVSVAKVVVEGLKRK